MTVFNIRRGFATNSSSTHSVVFCSTPHGLKDYLAETEGHYGWENFVLASPHEKMKYLASHLIRQVGADVARPALDIIGVDPEELVRGKTYDGKTDYMAVDHQSMMAFPLLASGAVNTEFFRDLATAISAPSVVILGGNDNSEGHPDSDVGTESTFTSVLQGFYTYQGEKSVLRSKKDKAGWWALYSTRTGLKVRGSFDPNAPRPEFSYRPELVDLKITDFCEEGCSYCYQGSTPSGKHADLEYIEDIADALAFMGVFEVAIGGGEPTTHPHFRRILEMFIERGITPNFTTRSTKWFKELDGLQDAIGGVAFSTQTPTDVRLLNERLKELGVRVEPWLYDSAKKEGWNLVHQHVMGMETRKEFEAYLKAIDASKIHSLTLLGYKTTGRGGSPKLTKVVNAYPWLAEALFEATKKYYANWGVDTAIVQTHGASLVKVGAKKVYLSNSEGAFSMYIDAVAKQAGPSSYHPEHMMEIKDPEDLELMYQAMPSALRPGVVEYGRRQ